MMARTRFLANATKDAIFGRQIQNRDDAYVKAQYEAYWASLQRDLEKATRLEDWLSIAGKDAGHGQFYARSGRLTTGAFDASDFYRGVLAKTLEGTFPKARSVAEYGCGVGRNLLFLKSRNPGLVCRGYELTQAGVDVAREAAKKFGLDVKYETLDYLRDDDARFVFGSCDVSFTMFSLEQLPHGVDRAVARILQRSTMGSIHLEPVPENYPWTYRGILGRAYSRKADYVKGLSAAARQQAGFTVKEEVLDTSHNPLMYPTLIVLQRDGQALATTKV